MSTFHGFYSIGGFAGALVSGALAAAGVAPFERALWPAVLLGAAAIAVHQWLPSAEPHTANPRPRVRVRIKRPSWPLVALGTHGLLQSSGRGCEWRLERPLSPQIARRGRSLRSNGICGVLHRNGSRAPERRLLTVALAPRCCCAAAAPWLPSV